MLKVERTTSFKTKCFRSHCGWNQFRVMLGVGWIIAGTIYHQLIFCLGLNSNKNQLCLRKSKRYIKTIFIYTLYFVFYSIALIIKKDTKDEKD